jgi:uncharacterized protein YegP (UPF0339 family)
MGKYVITKSASGKFMFNLKSANHQTILTSEMYSSKSGCENGIESVRKNSPEDNRFERKTSKGGDPYFVLKAANGEPIGRSEMYSSTSAMENGIESVKKNGPDSELADES